jgi:hypothetical protein
MRRFVRSFPIVAALVLTTACGERADAPEAVAAGTAAQALGVAAYQRAATDPLVARLLDDGGEVRGEFVRLGVGEALAFELIDADGRSTSLSLAESPALTADGGGVSSDAVRLLRAVALDPAFHGLAPVEGAPPAVEAAESALRVGSGPTTEQRRCWDGCADDYLDCQFGNYPEVCDDVYDACIRICDFTYPRQIKVGSVLVGTASGSLAR